MPSKHELKKASHKRRKLIMRMRDAGKSYNEIARALEPPISPQRVAMIVRDQEENGLPEFDLGRKAR